MRRLPTNLPAPPPQLSGVSPALTYLYGPFYVSHVPGFSKLVDFVATTGGQWQPMLGDVGDEISNTLALFHFYT